MDKKKIKEAAKKYGKRMMVSCNEFAKSMNLQYQQLVLFL